MIAIKHILFHVFLVSVFVNATDRVLGQKPINVRIVQLKKPIKTQKVFPLKKKCNNRIEAENYLNDYINFLQKEGYLLAQIDSIVFVDSVNVNGFIDAKTLFTWGNIGMGNIPPELYSKTWEIEHGKPLKIEKLTEGYEKVISFYENIGHPFANISLDSVIQNGDTISGVLNLDKGKLIKIDSIKIKGNAKISEKYLNRHIDFSPGDIYSELKIKAIENKISELSFIGLKSPPEVFFTNEFTSLNLDLVKAKNSNFQGLIGALPDENGNVLITGEANLKLVNSFYRGEQLNLHWKRIANNTQNLEIEVAYPYLFNSDIGINASLDLFRKDTSFSNFSAAVGLQYLFKAQDFVEVFVENRTSNILGKIILNSSSPKFLDVSTISYGIAFQKQKLNYSLNPTKGYFITAKSSVGEKKINRNPNAIGIEYDSLNLETTDVRTNLNVSVYIPFSSRITFKIQARDERILSSNLFENEFKRIGGLFTLRGFDEESIYASSFSLLTIEPRFILEKNSNLYAFVDLAYYENKTLLSNIKGYPIGFGAGISFEATPGIFTFNYALGRNIFFENNVKKTSDFSLRSGKVHFGFINYF